MYMVMDEELKLMQLTDSHPQDYLNFYCLGNWEEFYEDASNSNGAAVSINFQ